MSETIHTPEITSENNDLKKNKDLFALISDRDPVSGLTYDWLEIREMLVSGIPVGKVLPLMFDYYESNNPAMSSWSNYLLACSHFTEHELNDGQANKAYRRKLEVKVKRLIRARKQDQHTNIHDFVYKNAAVI